MADLAVILLDQYRQEELDDGFRTAFRHLNLAAAFQSGEKILIKPNLLAAVPPERATTPHPSVFQALIQSLQDLGLDLSYGDSPPLDSMSRAAKISGLAAIAEKYGVAAADFETAVDTQYPQGKSQKHLPLAAGAAAADGLVSLAKLKTHALTGMTGALKNQFGVIPGQQKLLYHVRLKNPDDFAQMLVDINRCLQPRLFVLDAIMAMEGNGPRNGQPRRVGAVLLSQDPVAVDAAAAYLIGMSPADIITTRIAARDGLGDMDLSRIRTCLIRPGTGAEGCKTGQADQLLAASQVCDFIRPRAGHSVLNAATILGGPLIRRYVLQRPFLVPDRCIGCGACADTCPARPGAIRMQEQTARPQFDYQNCIRCFCCQETCPAGAIEVQRTRIGRLLQA